MLQQWAMMLSACEYSIEFKPGRFLANANGLSLPTPTTISTACLPGELVLLLKHLETTLITDQDVFNVWLANNEVVC